MVVYLQSVLRKKHYLEAGADLGFSQEGGGGFS